MLLGRNGELNQLNHYYEREGSQIIVVYGQKHIGKTALLKEFSGDKPAGYYMARSCSEREQVYQWSHELGMKELTGALYPSYTDILTTLVEGEDKKKVLVIDEFQNMLKTGSTFMAELVSFVNNPQNHSNILVILVSSSVGFIENSMLKKIGEAAYSLSGLLKLKELKFQDCVDFFSGFTRQQCIEVYAILGGLPGLWSNLDVSCSVKENIIKNILSPTSTLYYEAERLLSEELRETAVYNTLLAAIAGGRHKLNDLYLHTGFSRAKISVYLKNLMELEIVEKVFSYDTEGNANVQKGIYRIRSRFMHFYYKFLYPHMSEMESRETADFYTSLIEPELKPYVAEYFKSVCREHMERMNETGGLPFVYDRAGEWVGKEGNIDMIAQDEDAHTMLVLCNYEKPLMPYEDYERLLYCASKARLHVDYIFLYSIGRFDEKLYLEAKVKKNIALVSMSEL
ncbi:MAG: ATP-binding protein [Lachnospiraceae bacterium]|nr:ATP-binding protein [Lachnospiraceae bacterium]